MKITAIIPARQGSKGIVKKNIKLLNGIPLILYSIEHAKKSKFINEIIVTTDCNDIADISKNNGASVPYLRPKNISDDLSTDHEFIKYHIEWCKNNDIDFPDLMIQLRPTYPIRDIIILDDCIHKMIINKSYDSLRTVILNQKTPYKMYAIENNILIPLFEEINGIKEPYNQPRQILPDTYLHNGYIDIIRTKSFLKSDSITGNKIYPYLLDKNEIYDIDTMDDWEKVEKIIINRTTGKLQ
jgi:CMP-N,N'-diacetyllegionaminic acid synthase